jgi:hypothetical protein
MRSFLKRRLALIALLVVLLTGGAVAAMAAGGTTTGRAPHRHGISSPRGARLLQAAATYIGIPVETLIQDLHSGKSLAQLATANGKTEAGLVQVLATTARAGLEQRLAQAIKQPGGLRGGGHARGLTLRLAAASYLGTTSTALQTQLRSGLTLAQVADATPGHSRAGLIAALLATRNRKFANPLLFHSGVGEAARSGRLRRHITAFVDRSHVAGLTRAKAPAAGPALP